MVPGAPAEARWIRPEPRRTLPAHLFERIVNRVFPRARVAEVEYLADGLRNANFKLRLDHPAAPLVLRVYEHDASLCRKEMDLMRLVGSRVPVPEILDIEERGFEDVPAFVVMRFVEGVSFLALKRTGDTARVAQAAAAVGETLAAIASFTFPKPGWLAAGPAVTAPLLEGPDPMPRFVDACLESRNLQGRVPSGLCHQIHELVWRHAERLADVSGETRLVHGDFSRRNLLVRPDAGRWTVAAVLDWEFAVSGSPLADLGSFLRYERAARPLAEPHFSEGYRNAGGVLPPDWRTLAGLVGLTATCESLTRDGLPAGIAAELVELVRATVETRGAN
jgi:aminoglycoside phosphotransferase (APT) family kinase protein